MTYSCINAPPVSLLFQEHQQYNTVSTECQEWIETISQKLSLINLDSYKLSEITSQLESLQRMKQSLQQGQNKLHYVLELKEKVLLTTEPTGANKIQEDTAALQHEFDKLMTRIQDIRQTLTGRSNSLQDIDKINRALLEWLEEMKAKLNARNSEGKYSDLTEKRAVLEKLRIVERETITHAEQFNKFNHKLNELPARAKEEYDQVNSAYNELKKDVHRYTEELEEIVFNHEKYIKQFQETKEFLRNCLETLQNYSASGTTQQSTSSKDSIAQKLDELNKFREESLKKGMQMFELTKDLAQKVIVNSTAECRDGINEECRQLQVDLEKLSSASKDAELNLKKSLTVWNKFNEMKANINRVVNSLQAKLNAADLIDRPTLADLQQSKDLLSEINSQRAALMDDFNDTCEILIELAPAEETNIRADISKAQTEFNNLLSSAHELIAKNQKSLSDHTEFLRAKEAMEKWLTDVTNTLTSCESEGGDEESMKRNYETLQSIAARMTEGQHLLNVAQDTCTAALNIIPDEAQIGLKSDIKGLRDKWDQLGLELKTKTTRVKVSSSAYGLSFVLICIVCSVPISGFFTAMGRFSCWNSTFY